MEVRFYDEIDDGLLKFAVIISRTKGKWVFCKHRERDTFEVPGGHRELGETIMETARRELYEETGAINYQIEKVCVYSVASEKEETFGMLYVADIEEFEQELHSEIEAVYVFDELPDKWTYPLIQPLLIKEYEKRFENHIENLRGN